MVSRRGGKDREKATAAYEYSFVHLGDLVCRCSPRRHETWEIRMCNSCGTIVAVGDDGREWPVNERLYDLPDKSIPTCAATVRLQRKGRRRESVSDQIRASRTTCYAFMKDADI